MLHLSDHATTYKTVIPFLFLFFYPPLSLTPAPLLVRVHGCVLSANKWCGQPLLGLQGARAYESSFAYARGKVDSRCRRCCLNDSVGLEDHKVRRPSPPTFAPGLPELVLLLRLRPQRFAHGRAAEAADGGGIEL